MAVFKQLSLRLSVESFKTNQSFAFLILEELFYNDL